MSEKIEIKSIYIRPMWVDSKLKMMIPANLFLDL